ncbi:MAG TPA: hypothetical protein VNO81_03155 [Candidatus Nitrosotenuis sp.]|jgi:hypothetical protein|nr:hypothetical protein [Candidatus Nitrosotenuis sp.]
MVEAARPRVDFSRALSCAWNRCVYLLWERRSVPRIACFAFLNFLSGGAGGGGASFNYRIPLRDEKSSAVTAAGAATLAALGAGYSASEGVLIAAVLLFVLSLALLLGWLGAVARLVLLENMAADREAVVEPFARLARLGTSWFLFVLGMGLVCLLLLGGMAAAGFGLYTAGILEEGMTGAVILLVSLGILLFLGLVLLMLLINLFHGEVVAPIMYRRQVGALEAWSDLLARLRQAPGLWALYVLLRTALGVGAGMAAALALIVCLLGVLLVVGILVGLPTLVLTLAFSSAAKGIALGGLVVAIILFLVVTFPLSLVVATPGSIFLRAFSIYVLQQVEPDYYLLPWGGPQPARVDVPEAG